MIDEELDRYREIGERNRVVLQLLQNWCAHAEVVRESSGGLFEQVTGLPISMCRVTCKHERAPGSISMHLEENALSFYDRNCIDCTVRRPVALPNLSELVGQRDSRREDAERREEERQRAAREALELRRAHRERAFPSATPAQASLAMLLDRLDTEASAETAEELVAAVLAVPDELNDDFLDAIASVVAVGGMHRSAGGLRALEASSFPRQRLVGLALESLRGRERAGEVVELAARHMGHAVRDDIRAVVPGMVWACRRSHFALPGEANGHTSALVSAHRAHPEVVESAIRKALAQDGSVWRQAGCAAASALLAEGHAIDVESLCDSLLASFRLPDSIEGEGPAYEVVARLLARLLCRYPPLVLPRLLRHEGDDHEQVKVGVFRAYCSVLRRDGVASEEEAAADAQWGPESAQAQVLSRVLALTADLGNDDRLQEAVGLLRRGHNWFGRLADPSVYVPTMLGAAAMACSRVEALSQPSGLIVDPRPADVRQLDWGGDTSWLWNLAYTLVEMVAWISSQHPNAEARRKSGELYLDTLKALGPMADRFHSRLVRHLGKLYRGREWRNAVLPEIYSALAHPSVGVRADAGRAYEDVCKVVGPEALPSLLHEAFLVHLQDPYVAVHKGAVAALQHMKVPQEFTEDILGLLARAIDVYTDESAERRDDFFVAEALSVVVRLASESPQGLRYVVRVARRLRPEAVYSLLQDRVWHLRNVRGIAELLLVVLPTHPPIWGDYESEFVLRELALLPRAEIVRAATRIVEVGVEAGKKRLHSVIPLMRILDANGESAAARSMIATVLAAAGTDRVNLGGRLVLSLYLEALELEQAVADGDMGRVEELAASIHAIESQLAEDEELNRKRRQHDAFD